MFLWTFLWLLQIGLIDRVDGLYQRTNFSNGFSNMGFEIKEVGYSDNYMCCLLQWHFHSIISLHFEYSSDAHSPASHYSNFWFNSLQHGAGFMGYQRFIGGRNLSLDSSAICFSCCDYQSAPGCLRYWSVWGYSLVGMYQWVSFWGCRGLGRSAP